MTLLPFPIRHAQITAATCLMALAVGACAGSTLEPDVAYIAPPCPRTTDYTEHEDRSIPNRGGHTKGLFGDGAEQGNYVEVALFYATNRKRSGSCLPDEIYGAELGRLEYGRVLVSIPHDHRMGELESPSILKLEFRNDPEEHITVLSVDPTQADRYFAELSESVRTAPGKQALVFIHGYNATFADAAQRTAQIAYDLKFPGAPILYSWPSEGTLPAYNRDREASVQSAEPLAHFLDELRRRSGAETIHLIAHSMGNQPLALALGSLVPQKSDEELPLFQEIVLAAPDINAEVFQREIAPVIGHAADRVTLYTSASDRALRVARDFADFPRLGDASVGIVLHEGIETIDATFIDTSLTGHSYFGENRSVMSDLYNLLKKREPAGARFGLVLIETPRGNYWRFQR